MISGEYWLKGVPAGTVIIREVLPPGSQTTFPTQGFHTVVVRAGETVRGVDFGNTGLDEGDVHGTKWRDLDGDGVRDPGEPGVVGVTIYADLNNNMMLDAGEPSAVTMPVSPNSTAGDGNQDGLVDDADYLVWRSNFGRTSSAAGLSGDYNGDGRVDAADYVLWRKSDGTRAEVISGEYWLKGVPAGTVIIREVLPPGSQPTFPTQGFHTVVVKAGETVRGVDFGNRGDQTAPTATIHGRKLLDQGVIGRLEDDNVGIGGVTIYVDLNNNGVRDVVGGVAEPSGVTNTDGHYWIMNIPPGVWSVREIVPTGFVQTFPTMPAFHTVDLSPGEDLMGVNFGNRNSTQPTGSGAGMGTGEIRGVKWLDVNRNATARSGRAAVGGRGHLSRSEQQRRAR